MIRAVLISLLSGILIGGGGVGAFAYIVAQTNNDRLLILEADTHRITHDFDMGMKMVGDTEAEQIGRLPLEKKGPKNLYHTPTGRRTGSN